MLTTANYAKVHLHGRFYTRDVKLTTREFKVVWYINGPHKIRQQTDIKHDIFRKRDWVLPYFRF